MHYPNNTFTFLIKAIYMSRNLHFINLDGKIIQKEEQLKFWSNWKLHHCLWVLWFFFLLSVRNFSRVMREATYRFNEIIVHFYIAGLYISNCVRIKETEYISYIYKTIHHGHRDTCKNYLLQVMYWYKFYVYIVVFNARKMLLLKLCSLDT